MQCMGSRAVRGLVCAHKQTQVQAHTGKEQADRIAVLALTIPCSWSAAAAVVKPAFFHAH